MFRLLVFLTIVVGVVFGQQGQNGGKSVQDLISSIFNQTSDRNPGGINLQPGPIATPAPPQEVVTGSNGCQCVPYYLCNNGTINKDGVGIIDIRYKKNTQNLNNF